MASSASDSLPSSPPPPASAILDGNHRSLFLDQATSSFFPAAAAQQEPPPPAPAPAARRPPRKRPRASRRPPTTVLTTDTSNFRAMVQEFTGFPAPPPYLGPAGVLFDAAGAPVADPAAAAGTRAPLELLMRPSPLIKLPAAPHTTAPAAASASSFARSLFADSSAIPAAATPSSSSELYSFFESTTLSGAAPSYDGGFEASGGERAEHGHGLFSSFLHAGDRYQYHSH